MFERFTVDVVAENVATQLLEGDPTAKLAHRFFRKGRRDGRRDYAFESIAWLVRDAVRLAGSTLVEDFVNKRQSLLEQIAQLSAAVERDLPPEPADLVDELPDPPSKEEMDSAELLETALLARRRLQREHALAAARRAREAAIAAAADAREGMVRCRRQLDELRPLFDQRLESIEHTGQMLWSRYCNGFAQGHKRRGKRGADVEPPTETLTFDSPRGLSTLLAVQTSEA